MRPLVSALPLVCALGAGGAWAQSQFEGLDLTEPPKKEEPKKEPGKKDPPKKTPDELDFSNTAPPPIAERPAAPVGPTSQALERDVTQDDRVKSVQRKLYLKRGRFELAPAFVVNVNDAYYTKIGFSVRGAFYPADTLAISVRFTLLETLPTDDVRTAKRNLSSRIFYSVPSWTLMGNAEWSPLYGKVAIFNSILHFDGYLLGGAGVVFTETSASTTVGQGGPKPGFDLGIGLRFVTKDWLAVNLGLINTAYVDIPTGTTKASLQNVMLLTVGVSLFFPFKSTYREAE
jgi:outer membrane beta-barrel protein